jgi:hypothetical protein
VHAILHRDKSLEQEVLQTLEESQERQQVSGQQEVPAAGGRRPATPRPPPF